MAKVTVRKETGKLVIDFTYRGVRCREQTALPDTTENRKRPDAWSQSEGCDVGRHVHLPGLLSGQLLGRAVFRHNAGLTTGERILQHGGRRCCCLGLHRSATPTFQDFTASGSPSTRSSGAGRTSRC